MMLVVHSKLLFSVFQQVSISCQRKPSAFDVAAFAVGASRFMSSKLAQGTQACGRHFTVGSFLVVIGSLLQRILLFRQYALPAIDTTMLAVPFDLRYLLFQHLADSRNRMLSSSRFMGYPIWFTATLCYPFIKPVTIHFFRIRKW